MTGGGGEVRGGCKAPQKPRGGGPMVQRPVLGYCRNFKKQACIQEETKNSDSRKYPLSLSINVLWDPCAICYTCTSTRRSSKAGVVLHGRARRSRCLTSQQSVSSGRVRYWIRIMSSAAHGGRGDRAPRGPVCKLPVAGFFLSDTGHRT